VTPTSTSALGGSEWREGEEIVRKGKPITTMSYDWWLDRPDHRFDGTRFDLQEIFLSSLTNFLYDDGRDPGGTRPGGGFSKKLAIANWANRIELLAMVEDTHDGQFFAVPPQGGALRPNFGPVAVGTFSYARGARGGQRGDAADRRAPRARALHGADRDAGAYASHPRAAAGWATRPTSARSTQPALPMGTRGCTASTLRSSRPRSGSIRR
jgi:hypothetical protein